MKMKSYLGDGVYAEWNGDRIVLTTDAPNINAIVLEPDVYVALLVFVEQVMFGWREKGKHDEGGNSN